jgi:hypothetical protein
MASRVKRSAERRPRLEAARPVMDLPCGSASVVVDASGRVAIVAVPGGPRAGADRGGSERMSRTALARAAARPAPADAAGNLHGAAPPRPNQGMI